MANFNRAAFLKRAKRALAHNLSEPGDCAGDLPLLIGLSLAQAEIGQGAGWIPVVQKLGCEIAALAKDVQLPAPVQTCTVQFEYTDTFGGEANYSWVRRHEATFPADISDRALVRRAKAWAGLTGVPCRTENLGDLIALYPQGSCTVLFISAVY